MHRRGAAVARPEWAAQQATRINPATVHLPLQDLKAVLLLLCFLLDSLCYMQGKLLQASAAEAGVIRLIPL